MKKLSIKDWLTARSKAAARKKAADAAQKVWEERTAFPSPTSRKATADAAQKVWEARTAIQAPTGRKATADAAQKAWEARTAIQTAAKSAPPATRAALKQAAEMVLRGGSALKQATGAAAGTAAGGLAALKQAAEMVLRGGSALKQTTGAAAGGLAALKQAQGVMARSTAVHPSALATILRGPAMGIGASALGTGLGATGAAYSGLRTGQAITGRTDEQYLNDIRAILGLPWVSPANRAAPPPAVTGVPGIMPTEPPMAPFTFPAYEISPERKSAYAAIMANLAKSVEPGLMPTAKTPGEQAAMAAQPVPKELGFGQSFVAGAGKALGAMSFGAGPGGPTLTYRPELAALETAATAETEAKKKQLELESQRNIEATASREDESARYKEMIRGQNLERQGNLLKQMEEAEWHKYQATNMAAKLKYDQAVSDKVYKMQEKRMEMQWGRKGTVAETQSTGLRRLWGTDRKVTYSGPMPDPADENTNAAINRIMSQIE